MDNSIFFVVGLALALAVALLVRRTRPAKPDLSRIAPEKRPPRARTTTKNGKKLRR